MPLTRVAGILRPTAEGTAAGMKKLAAEHPEQAIVAQRIAQDLVGRITVLLELGLGYLSLERSTPTLSPGELQRLRLATQVRSNLFGVVYVLDEPSAGLHPADTEALLAALDAAEGVGQFAVRRRTRTRRHPPCRLDRRRRDRPPASRGAVSSTAAPPAGLEQVEQSQTRRHLFGRHCRLAPSPRAQRLAATDRRHTQ